MLISLSYQVTTWTEELVICAAYAQAGREGALPTGGVLEREPPHDVGQFPPISKSHRRIKTRRDLKFPIDISRNNFRHGFYAENFPFSEIDVEKVKIKYIPL